MMMFVFLLMSSILRLSVENMSWAFPVSLFAAAFASGMVTSTMAAESKLKHSLFSAVRIAGLGLGLLVLFFVLRRFARSPRGLRRT